MSTLQYCLFVGAVWALALALLLLFLQGCKIARLTDRLSTTRRAAQNSAAQAAAAEDDCAFLRAQLAAARAGR